MFFSVLGLGFLIGMQHAFEADHIAAVSTIASRKTGLGAISRHGLFWGLGHTLTLFVVAGTAILLKTSVNEHFASILEATVGVMLIALGAHLLIRLWRERVHFHVHEHQRGKTHFHAHSHQSENMPHASSLHDHEHTNKIPWRTFGIGLMHGIAGSAALVILASTTMATPMAGLVYIGLFAIGSIFGMVTLTAVIALPLTYTAKYMTWTNRGLQLSIASITIAIGSIILLRHGELLLSKLI